MFALSHHFDHRWIFKNLKKFIEINLTEDFGEKIIFHVELCGELVSMQLESQNYEEKKNSDHGNMDRRQFY